MDKNNSDRNLFADLLQEINSAIINSRGVHALIKEMTRSGEIDAAMDKDLFVALDQLIKVIAEEENDPSPSVHPETPSEETSANNTPEDKTGDPDSCFNGKDHWIDGKKLSRSEILFQAFLADRFDEDKWCREIGISFNSQDQSCTLRELKI